MAFFDTYEQYKEAVELVKAKAAKLDEMKEELELGNLMLTVLSEAETIDPEAAKLKAQISNKLAMGKAVVKLGEMVLSKMTEEIVKYKAALPVFQVSVIDKSSGDTSTIEINAPTFEEAKQEIDGTKYFITE